MLEPLVRAFPSLGLVSLIINATILFIAQIAALHATLYDKIQPGYNVVKVFTMVRNGWRGFLKVLGENVKLNIIAALVGVAFILIPVFGAIAMIGEIAGLRSVPGWTFTMTGLFSEIKILMQYTAMLAPYSIVVIALTSIMLTIITLLSCNMVGLWMMQFRVSEWGDSGDPLPTPLQEEPAAPAPISPQIITGQDLKQRGKDQSTPSHTDQTPQASAGYSTPPTNKDNSTEKTDEHEGSTAEKTDEHESPIVANFAVEKPERPEDTQADSSVEPNVAGSEGDEKTCTACGTKNPPDAEVCSRCGKPFNTRSRRLCSL